MSRRDPPTGVSGVVVAAALALGGALLLPGARAGDDEQSVAPIAACPPETANSGGDAPAIPVAPR
jgi:hypothetical protein